MKVGEIWENKDLTVYLNGQKVKARLQIKLTEYINNDRWKFVKRYKHGNGQELWQRVSPFISADGKSVYENYTKIGEE